MDTLKEALQDVRDEGIALAEWLEELLGLMRSPQPPNSGKRARVVELRRVA